MSKFSAISVAAAVALALSACAQTQAPAPAVDQAAEAAKAKEAQEQANKELVTGGQAARGGAPAQGGAAPAGGAGGGSFVDTYLAKVSPEYIQHNPQDVLFNEVNKVSARDGFKLKFDTMAKMRGGAPGGPPPAQAGAPPNNQQYAVLADGDLVITIHERQKLVPGTKDKFVPEYSFDMVRVKDGKFVEHWDAATIPEKLPEELRVPVSEMKFPAQKK